MAANGTNNAANLKNKGAAETLLSKATGKLPVSVDSADWILKKMAGMRPTDVLTSEKRKSLLRCALSYGGAFVGLILSAITIYIASTDDKALTDGFFKYMILIILPIIIGSALVLPIFQQRFNMKMLVMNGFIGLVFVMAMYTYQQTKNPASVKFMRYTIYGLAFLSVIVGMAIAFKIFYRYIHSTHGWVSVVFQILFYLPCLVLEFIEFIKAEIGVAPNTVFVLLVIEAVLITSFFVIPPAYNWVYSAVMPKPNDNLILKDPIFLNTEAILADNKMLSTTPNKDDVGLSTFSYRANYTVSFWAYLNHNNDPNENPILCLGQKDEMGGKPLVSYSVAKGNYRMYLTNQLAVDGPSPQFEMHLPLQKWNYFVFSYDEDQVHIFVNGDLVKTYKFDETTRPSYSEGDSIIAGMNPGAKIRNAPGGQSATTYGASGSICHVRYYTSPITQREVVSEYNLYMYSNPPVPVR
jgi:hypothetical protein